MTSRAQAGASTGDNAAANTQPLAAPKSSSDLETLIGEWEQVKGNYEASSAVERAGDALVVALREAEKERERLEQEIDAMDSRRAFEWERAEAAEGDNRKLREALEIAKRLRAAVENCTDETVPISVEKAREAVIALTEMRGFVGLGPAKERDFMLPRIDLCAEVFGVASPIRAAHHDVIEGVATGDGKDT